MVSRRGVSFVEMELEKDPSGTTSAAPSTARKEKRIVAF